MPANDGGGGGGIPPVKSAITGMKLVKNTQQNIQPVIGNGGGGGGPGTPVWQRTIVYNASEEINEGKS